MNDEIFVILLSACVVTLLVVIILALWLGKVMVKLTVTIRTSSLGEAEHTRIIMSKLTELVAAVDRAIQVIQNPPVPQDVTPDADVQGQVDRLNAATTPAVPTP